MIELYLFRVFVWIEHNAGNDKNTLLNEHTFLPRGYCVEKSEAERILSGPPAMEQSELTHIDRVPLSVAKCREQRKSYVAESMIRHSPNEQSREEERYASKVTVYYLTLYANYRFGFNTTTHHC